MHVAEISDDAAVSREHSAVPRSAGKSARKSVGITKTYHTNILFAYLGGYKQGKRAAALAVATQQQCTFITLSRGGSQFLFKVRGYIVSAEAYDFLLVHGGYARKALDAAKLIRLVKPTRHKSVRKELQRLSLLTDGGIEKLFFLPRPSIDLHRRGVLKLPRCARRVRHDAQHKTGHQQKREQER